MMECSTGERSAWTNTMQCVVKPIALILFSLYYSSSVFAARQEGLTAAAHLFLVFLVPFTNLFFILSPKEKYSSPSIPMLAALGFSAGVSLAYSEIFLFLLCLFFKVAVEGYQAFCWIAPGLLAVWGILRFTSRRGTQANVTVLALFALIIALTFAIATSAALAPGGALGAIAGIVVIILWYAVASIAIYFIMQIPFIPLLCLEGTWYKFREQLSFWTMDKAAAIRFASICIMLGAAAPFLIDTSIGVSRISARKVAESNSESSRAAIRLLEIFGNKNAVLESSYEAYAPNLDMCAMALHDNGKVAEAQKTFFRLTGARVFDEARPELRLDAPLRERMAKFNDIDPPDPALAMQDINGSIEKLSLSSSEYTIKYSKKWPIATTQWNLHFSNNSAIGREARAVVQLPPGSVLNAATIWMNGREVPISITGREVAKERYRKVVMAKRDPLLITTAGPDRLFVQCFPVTPGGLPIQLSFVSPLQADANGASVPLQAKIVDRNFTMSVLEQVRIEGTPARIFHAQKQAGTSKVDRYFFVLDGSKHMAPMVEQIRSVLQQLPQSKEASFVLASDEVSELSPLRTNPSAKNFRGDISTLTPALFHGGPDNVPFLLRSWKNAMKQPNAAVVWIHGPQPYLYGQMTPATVTEQFCSQNPNATRFIDCEVIPGSNKLVQSMDETYWLKNRPKIESLGSGDEALITLQDLLKKGSLVQPSTAQFYSNSVSQTNDPDDTTALNALLAKDEVNSLISEGNFSEASLLACRKHIVTSISGGVAIEEMSQTPIFRRTNPPAPYEPGLDGAVKVASIHIMDNVYRILLAPIISHLNRLNSVSNVGTAVSSGLPSLPQFNVAPVTPSTSMEPGNSSNPKSSLKMNDVETMPQAPEIALDGTLVQFVLAAILSFMLALCLFLFSKRKVKVERLSLALLACLIALGIAFAPQLRDLLLLVVA